MYVCRAWTRAHPHQDYLPMDFIRFLNKSWLFPPGQGSSYSSDGYVLLGMAIAAVDGDATWQDVDQKRVLANAAVPFTLNDTMFAKTGPCSQYPTVVHQYAMASAFDATGQQATRGRLSLPTKGSVKGAAAMRDLVYRLAPFMELNLSPSGTTDPPASQCAAANYTNGTRVNVFILPTNIVVPSADMCCAVANKYPISLYAAQWSFLPNGTCLLLFEQFGPPIEDHTAVSGTVLATPLTESMFFDLYNDSCLNGYVRVPPTPDDDFNVSSVNRVLVETMDVTGMSYCLCGVCSPYCMRAVSIIVESDDTNKRVSSLLVFVFHVAACCGTHL